MGQGECKPCSAADPTSDTVKVDSTLLAQPDAKVVLATGAKQGDVEEKAEAEAKRQLEEQERLRRAEESERHRAAEEEARRARAEAEAARRLREEAEQRLERAAAERAAAEVEAAEKARKAKDEEEAETARTAERERAQAEKQVATFLRERGFKSISAPRKKLFKASYPLHVAVEEKNTEMVRLLLKCGADASSKNSAGKTPRELAQALNKRGSHTEVLTALTQ